MGKAEVEEYLNLSEDERTEKMASLTDEELDELIYDLKGYNIDTAGTDEEDTEDDYQEDNLDEGDEDIEEDADKITNPRILMEKEIRKRKYIRCGDTPEVAEMKADAIIRNMYTDEELANSDETDLAVEKAVKKLIAKGYYNAEKYKAELSVKLNYGLSPEEAYKEIIADRKAKVENSGKIASDKYANLLSAADRKACDKLKIGQPWANWTYEKYYKRLKKFGMI